MEEEELDLENDWGELRGPKIEVVSSDLFDLYQSLEAAKLKAEYDLQVWASKSAPTQREVVKKAADLIAKNWVNDLRGRDLTCLLQIILGGLSLPVDSLKRFVRALPLELIDRALSCNLDNDAKGIHGLLSIESNYRHNNPPGEYELARNSDGGLSVGIYHQGQFLQFSLSDEFRW